jgi:hypothetical protein
MLPLISRSLALAHRQPGIAERRKSGGHVVDRLLVAHRAGKPALAGIRVIVRPTAKPFTILASATAPNAAFSSSSGASSPSSTIPRQKASFLPIAASMLRQAAADPCGSSFHQSGFTPVA